MLTTVQPEIRPFLAGPRGRALRRLWSRLVVFSMPILAIVAPAVRWVDPFNHFEAPSPIPLELRMSYAATINQALWKVFSYTRSPKPNILLGDSEVARLPEDQVSLDSGRPYANLATGGATLRENIDMFWFATRRSHLEHVLFGVDFMSYNANPKSRVPQAEMMVGNPTLYFLDFEVLQAGAYQVSDVLLHRQVTLVPAVSRAAMWESQLQYLTGRYKRAADLGAVRNELEQIARYSREHGIQFNFIIPPQSTDVQQVVRAQGMEPRYEAFKRDLAQIAPVYDCDIDSSLTRNRGNFLDPVHLEVPAARELVSDLWSGHPGTYCTLESR